MIPFLRPCFDHRELLAISPFGKGSVGSFEREFARKFNSRFAVSFSSASGALYTALCAMGVTGGEIIMPAYTCVVVAHAIVLSGNIPVFVDISLDDFNMELEQLKKKLSVRTQAIIATSLFGYPIDVGRIREICGRDIFVVHDCALAPGVNMGLAGSVEESDVQVYSFNVRKPISTLGGGMITTSDEGTYRRIRDTAVRSRQRYGSLQQLGKYPFFLSQFLAFNRKVHTVVDFLANRTRLLDRFIHDYTEDLGTIPCRYFRPMLDCQARVGLVQLGKYDMMIRRRREIAKFYDHALKAEQSMVRPLIAEDAVYSHYCIRVRNRKHFIERMREKGISVGCYFDYCIPELGVYQQYKDGDCCNSVLCSKQVVNLPNHPGLRQRDLSYITSCVSRSLSEV